ncbi:MAG: hypothetical protein JW956_10860 [Calditrichaceae bacterium]|nr:hypothetical protein [Calditrichaceae bacterium]
MTIKKVFTIFSLLLLFACSVNDPKLPEWDTDWKIYMPTQDFIMGEEIINDSTFLAGYANDSIPIILFKLEDSTDWERVEASDLVLDPQTDHFSAGIGDIELGDYDDLYSDSTRIPEIIPAELFAVTDTLIPYDSLTVYPPDDSFEFTEYEYVTVEKGELWITFCNETFLNLREGLIAKIYSENGTSQYLGEIEFTQPISAHSTVQSEPLILNNRTIYNKFRIEYIIPVEANPSPRYLSEDDRNGYFCTVLSMGELIITEGRAKVPEQTAVDSAAVEIKEKDNQIISGTVESGSIHFNIQNMLPVGCYVTVSLPNFRENGLVKTFSSRITAGMNGVITEDISGLAVINHRSSGSVIDSLDYIATINSDSTTEPILITSEDSVIVDVTTDSIRMASVTGIIDTVDFDIESLELDEIDVFEDIEGQIRLNDLEMHLVFENEIDLPIYANLKIVGKRTDTADSVVINVSETIKAASASPTTIININDAYSDPSIVDLLEILPDDIKIAGNATVFGEGSVSVGDGLRARYTISSPLTIQIDEALTFKSNEIDSITYDDLDEEQRDQIVNDLADVSAMFNFINHIPIGGQLKYYMAIDSTDLYSDDIAEPSTKIVIEANIGPAIKGADGYVQAAVLSEWNQEFTDEQLEIFNYPTIYTRQELTILSTDGEVKIRQDDSIEIEAILDFKITVDIESD